MAAIPTSGFDPPIRPPIWRVMVDLGNRKWYPTFLFDFYTHYRPIHNAADRQAAMGKGRLCYNMGGPKTKKSVS